MTDFETASAKYDKAKAAYMRAERALAAAPASWQGLPRILRTTHRPRRAPMSKKVYLTVDQTPEGHFQLSIGDENGGYRIAGPKFDGRSKTVMRHEIRPRDVSEIGQYFSAVSTPKVTKNER
jgi:hypothetical protein